MTRDELIMLFYDGELDEVGEAEARALLARDPAARALLARLELVSSVLREVDPAAPAPPGITAAVMARVLEEPSAARFESGGGPWTAPRARHRSRRALAAVAVTLALAAGLALLLSRNDEPGSTAGRMMVPAPAGAASAPEPEPPEQSVAIERIDFGEDPGAIFLVPGVEERTIVVWTIDAAGDNGPEIEL